MPAGRPSSYTAEVADTICERLALGQSLVKILQDEDMPPYRTVCRWLSANEQFRLNYARAREDAAELMASEMVEIADSATDTDSAACARVRVDTRKWVASKLKPKVYGDRVDVNTTLDVRTTPDDRLESRLLELIRKAGTGLAIGGTGAAGLPEEPPEVGDKGA